MDLYTLGGIFLSIFVINQMLALLERLSKHGVPVPPILRELKNNKRTEELEKSIAELDKQIEEVTGFKEFFTPKGPTQQELNKLNPFLAEAVWRYHDASVYLPEGVTIGYLPLHYAWIVVGPKGSVKVEEHVGWWSNLERVKQAVKKVM
jgi:hypothetical protein